MFVGAGVGDEEGEDVGLAVGLGVGTFVGSCTAYNMHYFKTNLRMRIKSVLTY